MVFETYAKYYDIFYEKKDYERECRFLEHFFHRHKRGLPKTILDLGCGTGNHLIPLAKRGYAMTGVDASRQMLNAALDKLKKERLKAHLHCSQLQSFKLNRKFDCVISMFSVMDYLTTDQDLSEALSQIKKHLAPGSLFIFDFWNAQAVERFYSPKRSKHFKKKGYTVSRNSTSKLFRKKRLCEVNYVCRLYSKDRIEKVFKETHRMRYFNVNEIESFLKVSGFRVLDICPFLNPHGKIRSNTWDVTVVAQRISDTELALKK